MKNYIFSTVLVVFGVVTNFAQVGIGTTTPNANAALEVASTSQGMLFPRMTTTQRDAIGNPAKGLTIYNTTLNSIQTNTGTSGTPIWKIWDGRNPATNGTADVSGYSCTTASGGTMTAGVAIDAGTVTQTITATVTRTGTYTISTTANGVTFAKSGAFSTTGAQNIILEASGTPTVLGSNTFTLNTTPNCNFSRTTNQRSSNGTAIVSGYTCNTASGGKMIKDVLITTGVTQTITANVTTAGSYNISTTLANGVTFAGSGNFGGTGAQNVILTASGTPLVMGDDTFTLNTTPNCNFVRHTSQTGCYAKIAVSPDVYKDFLCHNLGADTSLNPDIPVVGLNGAYIQWGKRGPNTTGDSRVDWQSAASDGPTGFAAAPTATNANAGSIPSWSTTAAANYSWRTAADEKTANDPCPDGYRVPTQTELLGVYSNNTLSRTGTSTWSTTSSNGASNYGSALHFGSDASTKILTWPAAGCRSSSGPLLNRGWWGYYISSTESTVIGNARNIGFDKTNGGDNYSVKTFGYVVRCIADDSPTSNGTAEFTNFNCNYASAGTLTASTAVSGVTQTISVDVTRIGSYSISATANGLTFVGSGTFASTGSNQTIVLTATGTPTTVSDNIFTLNTSPNCSFTRTILNHPSSNGTALVSAYNCTTLYGGTLKVGEDASAVTQQITATVTTAGTYNITTNTANGIYFSGSGTFAGTGAKIIILTAVGTPNTVQDDTFTLNTTPNCNFVRHTSFTGCYAKTSSTVTKDFLCHNLGADTTLDPDVPVVGLNGAYIQWGKRGPNTTGDSRVDWQSAASDGPAGFAAAPTATNANGGSIPNWNTVVASNYSWRTAANEKTGNDPCPNGYRVPTASELAGLIANNTASRTLPFTNSNTNYGAALHFGPNANTKTLTWPATGGRNNTTGAILNRGAGGYYISSTESGTTNASNIAIDATNAGTNASSRLVGYSVRCIAE